MEYSAFYLEDIVEVREVICELIEISLNAKCLPLASVSEMISKKDTVLNTKLAILDFDLGINQPSGIDALNWLKKNHYQGQIYFLTGHGIDNPLLESQKDITILEKPVTKDLIIQNFKNALNSTVEFKP